jgi:hypothetical protein
MILIAAAGPVYGPAVDAVVADRPAGTARAIASDPGPDSVGRQLRAGPRTPV